LLEALYIVVILGKERRTPEKSKISIEEKRGEERLESWQMHARAQGSDSDLGPVIGP